MILSDSNTKNNSFLKTWGFLFVLVIAVSVIYKYSNAKTLRQLQPVSVGQSFVMESDLESVFDSVFFMQNQVRGVEFKSTDVARSGKYSIKLGGENRYGLQISIPNPKPNIRYEASVWVKNTSSEKGSLIVSADNSDDFYKYTNIPSKGDDQGWGLLEIPFTVPEIPIKEITVYVLSPKDAKPLYFDDIKVEKIHKTETSPLSDLGDEISLNIDIRALSRLDAVKKRAHAAGILIVEDDDWVNGTIQNNAEEIDVKLRYKGDWLDHLLGDKSSYRIKVKDPNNWKGMITFSVQSPATRYFLHEWIYHQFLHAEDVLTPRYDFINLKLNHKPLGIYAFEEHFDKQIVEHNQRREGPILKLTEDLFWHGFKNEMDIIKDGNIGRNQIDDFWRSDIRSFKESRTFASEGLKKSFELGQNLLAGWKYGELSASDVFDVERLAKYYAITDVNQAYHGIRWHNQRFYFNPVISKLEPIGFDGFGEALSGINRGPFIGYFNGEDHPDNLYDRLFIDPNFVRFYNYYIAKYTDEFFLKGFTDNLSVEIDERMKRIQVEFPEYIFNAENLINRGKNIQLYIKPNDNGSLLTRAQKNNAGGLSVLCINQHYLGLDVIGYAMKKDGVISDFDNKTFLRPRSKMTYGDPIQISAPASAKFIVYQVAGLSEKYYSEVLLTDFAKKEFPRLELEKVTASTSFPFLKKDTTTYYINKGDYTIDRDLVLPKNARLIVEGGTTIDVIHGAKIIVNGPVIMQGTAEAPIIFDSSDRSAQGFTVLQSPTKSFLKHTHFKNFNTLNHNGWTLTGAVTFYEADLELSQSSITHNLCEDALNTVRCNLDIDGLFISDTFGDGFDADFCTGIIDNTRCLRTGNDGFDFSGSKLTVKNCTIESAGDKGISIGEHAEVEIIKANIKSANIAVASKDLSVIDIHNITLKDCQQGFAVYQKKPEFGPANLYVRYYKMNGVKQPYMVDHGSRLLLKNKEIIGE